MGVRTPVPWRRVDRKQMLYPLDHDAPLSNETNKYVTTHSFKDGHLHLCYNTKMCKVLLNWPQ